MGVKAGFDAAANRGPCEGIPDERIESIRRVLDRIGDKWSLLVIGVLATGPLRYTDLNRQVPGISQRMLTLTLRQLQNDGLVARSAHAEVPPRVEYALTPLGSGLLDSVTNLVQWASDHHAAIRQHRTAGTAN